jgi:outer membrane protein assembly factor BamB
MTQRQTLIAAFAATLLCANIARAEENWPQFRGPTGLGYTGDRELPLAWGGDKAENVLWKAPLVGQGHASPIVWGQKLFVCTAHWPESVKQREKVIPEHHLLCYDTGDGKLLWDTQVPAGPWLRSDFRSGPGGGYAAPTPSTDGKLIYCVFGSAVIAAVDFQGKIAWRKEIVPYTFDVTIGGSPILYQDTVILFCPMAKKEDSAVIAWNKNDGQIKWSQKLPGTEFGHSTPVVIQVQGKPQMLVVASGMKTADEALQSLDPADGKRLWWCWGAGDVASPAFGGGLVFFDSGRGGPGVAVDPTGSGDVTATGTKWKINQVPQGLSSPIIVGDYVYKLHEPGVLKCWKLATGKQVYTERLDGISTTWASPVADPSGNLFFASAGKSYVVKAGPEFKVLATNDLGDANHPSAAVSGGRIFLVGTKNVYCIGKK